LSQMVSSEHLAQEFTTSLVKRTSHGLTGLVKLINVAK